MILYNNFIGIDIGKYSFVVASYGGQDTKEYENNHAGIDMFIEDHKDLLANSLYILETTGGYEMQLLLTLYEENFSVYRANTRMVKNFIRSLGNAAKTVSVSLRWY